MCIADDEQQADARHEGTAVADGAGGGSVSIENNMGRSSL
jgi:hypothetical protein